MKEDIDKKCKKLVIDELVIDELGTFKLPKKLNKKLKLHGVIIHSTPWISNNLFFFKKNEIK